MPFVEGESLRDRLRRREAAPGRGRAPDRAGGGGRARLRAPARRDPPRHQAGEHPAHRAATRWWPTSASHGRCSPAADGCAADRDRAGGRDAGLHEPGAGRRRARRWTRGPTSTRSASCSTRCSRESRRSPDRPRRRSSPGGSPSRRRASGTLRQACRSRWTRRSSERSRGCPPIASPPPRSSATRCQASPTVVRRRPHRRRPVAPAVPRQRSGADRRARHAARPPDRTAARCSPGAAPTRETSAAGGERRIAVLPFENLGDTADAYFADGITDAVRGKLTALPAMPVIASNSSAQYRAPPRRRRRSGASWGWTTCSSARCAGRRAPAARAGCR